MFLAVFWYTYRFVGTSSFPYSKGKRGWKMMKTTVDSSCVSLACTLCRFNAKHGQAWRWSIGREWLSCALLHLLCFKERIEKYIKKFYRFFVLVVSCDSNVGTSFAYLRKPWHFFDIITLYIIWSTAVEHWEECLFIKKKCSMVNIFKFKTISNCANINEAARK